ncbi:MAG: tyrosine-type recombinase/integrase, partial [Deltaproteobacteria bacterium]|nr:tyrosine-type recombinase/integrase [Deltaproteobacteria bacterium]
SALTWDDIDIESQLVQIKKSQVDGLVFPTKTKTNRTVPLFDIMIDILHEHRRWLKQRFGFEDGLVFPSRFGGYRDSSVTRTPLLRCARKAGLNKRVTNQCLRRTANNLIRQSAGEIAARAITGHATQAMTEHYSEVTMAEKLEAGAIAFGSLLKGQP